MANHQIMTIGGVDCYGQDGVAYLKLRTVALGLGFTDTSKGSTYVRWKRVDKYLAEIGFATSGERPDFIPENVFYRLAMKAKNETAEAFQAKVADEIIPAIRRHGGYMTPQAIEKVLQNPDTIIRMAKELKKEQAKRGELEDKAKLGHLLTLFSQAVMAVDTSTLIWALEILLKQSGVAVEEIEPLKPAARPPAPKLPAAEPEEISPYKETLRNILEFSGGRHLLTAAEVGRYTGLRDYRTIKRKYPFQGKYISAENLAMYVTAGERR